MCYMRLLSWMIPTEKRFFDMLMAQSAKTLEGVEALSDMINKFENAKEKAKKIKTIEEEGDNSLGVDTHDTRKRTGRRIHLFSNTHF